MPFVLRHDSVGSLHHVMNRGLARRPVFENSRDVRYFLSLLARQVRARRIEVLVFSLLTTHFHLLLRSTNGELSATMARVERAYARWFNARRRRDGPLFKGRFTSRRIDDEWYARAVELYIDRNPVDAGLAATPARYPWCSARLRSGRRVPRWLASGEQLLGAASWSQRQREEACWIVGRRIEQVDRRPPPPTDGLRPTGADDLVAGATPGVRAWLEGNAACADGIAIGTVVAAPPAILRAVGAAPHPPRDRAAGACDVETARRAAAAALLRSLAGLEWSAIANLLGIGRTLAGDRAREHRERVAVSGAWERWASGIVMRAVGDRAASVRN